MPCGDIVSPSQAQNVYDYINQQLMVLGLTGCGCQSDIIANYTTDDGALHAAFVVIRAKQPQQQTFTGGGSYQTGFTVDPEVDVQKNLLVVRNNVVQVLGINYTLVNSSTGNPDGPFDLVTLIQNDLDPSHPGLATGETLDFFQLEVATFMPIKHPGDMIVGDEATGSPSRLPIGTQNDMVLATEDGEAVWTPFATLLSDQAPVITSKGDLIVGDSSGDPSRLPIGTSNAQVLTVESGTAEWVDFNTLLDGSGLLPVSPITTKGDLIIGDDSGDPSRLPIGTQTSDVLTVEGGTAEWVPFASLLEDSGLLPAPVITAQGDLIIGDASGNPVRLPIGTTNGMLLTVLDGEPTWETYVDDDSGGGGGSSPQLVNIIVFDTPGAVTYTVSTDVSVIEVEMWGAGGQGFFDNSDYSGGGGGGYVWGRMTTTPATDYDLVVGGAVLTTNANGADSTFASTVLIAGGGVGATALTGGAGGTFSGSVSLLLGFLGGDGASESVGGAASLHIGLGGTAHAGGQPGFRATLVDTNAGIGTISSVESVRGNVSNPAGLGAGGVAGTSTAGDGKIIIREYA